MRRQARTNSAGIGRRTVVVGTAMAAAGMTGLLPTSSIRAESPPVPKRGGTVNVLLFADPPSLVTAGNSSGPSKLVSSKIIEGLLAYDFDLNPQPRLATSWTVSDDKREFSFALRRGVKWHDGRDFTSEDVAFSIRLAAEIRPTGRVIFKDVSEIGTPDPHTVTIRLSQPNPALLAMLSGVETAILPRHLYEGKDYFSNPVNANPIGTGPFVFKEWVRGSHIRLDRNPDYWDQPKPYVDRLILKIIGNTASAAAAFETGEIDIGYNNPIPLTDIDRFRSLSNIGIEKRGYETSGDWTNLLFNLENQYLRHEKVRRAIAHAIDRKVVLNVGWYGHGRITATPIGPSLARYVADDVPLYAFDPAIADRLLDEAGFPRGAGGNRFALTLDPLPATESFRNVANYIRQALGKVGIVVTIRTQEFAAYIKRVYTDRDFDFAYAWLITGPDPSGIQKYYWSKNFKRGVPFSNAPRYENAEFDRALEAGAVEPDERKRIAYYQEAQRIIARDLPTLELLAPSLYTIHSRKVRGHTFDADGVQGNFANLFIG